jgi:hypothetical protein
MRKVLDLTVNSCSLLLEEHFKGWTVELDSSSRKKRQQGWLFQGCPTAYQRLCRITHVIANTSLHGENTQLQCKTSCMTAKRRRTGPRTVGTADNGKNVQSNGNQPGSVAVPDTTAGRSQASWAVKRSVQQTGDNNDDKAASMEPTSLAKSAKQYDVSNVNNLPLIALKTAAHSGNSSMHTSCTLKMTSTHERGTFGHGSATSPSFITDAMVDPHSASKAQPASIIMRASCDKQGRQPGREC